MLLLLLVFTVIMMRIVLALKIHKYFLLSNCPIFTQRLEFFTTPFHLLENKKQCMTTADEWEVFLIKILCDNRSDRPTEKRAITFSSIPELLHPCRAAAPSSKTQRKSKQCMALFHLL